MNKVLIFGAGSIGNHMSYACLRLKCDVYITDKDPSALERMRDEIFQPRLLKMLLVNSGRFDFAEIDVDKSMHFHGGNNAGKTTIVNALQFLFVYSFKSMVWTPKGSKETR